MRRRCSGELGLLMQRNVPRQNDLFIWAAALQIITMCSAPSEMANGVTTKCVETTNSAPAPTTTYQSTMRQWLGKW